MAEWVTGELMLQQCMGKRQGTPWTGRQSIAEQHRDIQDKQPCTHSFGLWKEAGLPNENPRMHVENMQTPCRKTTGWESNPGPSCCKAIVLPTALRCGL
ncbi:hypothetical protein AMECASPLE_004977 [Ameca splendens]|uniref:Uncharacterized protein n=1 Tax=Ameca splendens TaxID=208324 RepID=A0ABV0YYE2_9TELE